MRPRFLSEGTMDEIRRCYYCQHVCFREEASKGGCCPKCGSRRFREVTRMTDEEMEAMRARGFEPEGWEHHDSPVG